MRALPGKNWVEHEISGHLLTPEMLEVLHEPCETWLPGHWVAVLQIVLKNPVDGCVYPEMDIWQQQAGHWTQSLVLIEQMRGSGHDT